MILKKTFYSSGTQKQDIAAALNEQLKDYLTTTGLFQLAAVETGNGNRPKYTLEYKGSGYKLVAQCHENDWNAYTEIGIMRDSLDENAQFATVNYGSIVSAQFTIHIVTHGDSFVFKVFNNVNAVCMGGSCIRYTKLSGEQGYLYSTREDAPWKGYMGRYVIEKGRVCQISYQDYPSTRHAVIQEFPIITLDGTAIGYANDIVTIHVNTLSDSHAFSVYCLMGEEYHGGKIACGQFLSNISSCTAAAMKGGN